MCVCMREREKMNRNTSCLFFVHSRMHPFGVRVCVCVCVCVQCEWAAGCSGGTLLSSPSWFLNPQYLLDVKRDTDTHISLLQPPGTDQRVTFYVLEYDGRMHTHSHTRTHVPHHTHTHARCMVSHSAAQRTGPGV